MKLSGSITRSLVVLMGLGLPAFSEEREGTYRLARTEVGHELRAPDGRTVLQYMTVKPEGSKLTANSTCCFYPVLTPEGTRVIDFAPDDHPHHRGIFLAWHNIQGEPGGDFWGWGEFAPTEGRVIRNKTVELKRATPERAEIEVRNEWMADEKLMMGEALSVTVSEAKGAYLIDLHYVLRPQHDLTLGRTAFSGFNVKSRKSKGVYTDPDGKVNRPAPHFLKPETDWPSRRWYDYTFELEDGTKAGVAVIDHAGNPRTTWHNLLPIAMLNPCIVAPGEVKLAAGLPLVLRYRLVVHDGPVPVGTVERAAKGYARR